MQALTNDDALVWCEARALHASPSGHLYFALDSPRSLLLNLPAPSSAHDLARALLPQPQEALLWVRPRSAWTESPGDKLFRGLRAAWEVQEPVAEKPALLFQPTQHSHLLAALLPALLFSWDAYLVPADAGYFAFTTQDVVCLVSRSKETQDMLAEQLRPFRPQPDSSWYFRRLQP